MELYSLAKTSFWDDFFASPIRGNLWNVRRELGFCLHWWGGERQLKSLGLFFQAKALLWLVTDFVWQTFVGTVSRKLRFPQSLQGCGWTLISPEASLKTAQPSRDGNIISGIKFICFTVCLIHSLTFRAFAIRHLRKKKPLRPSVYLLEKEVWTQLNVMSFNVLF